MARRLAPLALAGLLAAGSAFAAGTIDPKVQAQMDKSGPEAGLKVIVLFKDTPNFNLGLAPAEGAEARQQVEEALRANAHEAQKEFDLSLASEKGIKDVKHFW